MLLLHNNSLGDIIDTEKEKTKQEKKKKKTEDFCMTLSSSHTQFMVSIVLVQGFCKKNLFFFS